APDPLGTSPTDLPEMPGLNASFEVFWRGDGTTRVAATAWVPDGATTVLLAVHGSSGWHKRVEWDLLTVPGYSLGAHEASVGRAFVSIDRPGVGESPGTSPPGGTYADDMLVIHQVARALRAGTYAVEGGAPAAFSNVVGIGHSRGAGLVVATQAHHGSFDAVVPAAGATLTGPGKAWRECYESGPCRDDPHQPWEFFVLENADPRVVADVMDWAPVSRADGPTRGLLGPESPTMMRSLVRVPVLFIYGAEDFTFDREAMEDAPRHFPNAPRADMVMLEATGHNVFHHYTKDEAFTRLDAWLAEVRL
ncbi:MAG: alpha/beta hydrolase, partial [Methanobacteriota archaeon]